MHGLIQQPIRDAGAYVSGYMPRVVLHTTEGRTYPGPEIYHGTNPTFTCDFKHRKTYQHCSVDRAALALENHPGGVETNRAHAVQIELVGFTAESNRWERGDYEYIHSLLVHIRNAGHGFHMRGAHPWTQGRFSGSHWRRFDGVCGHMHVPENSHVDPGSRFPIHRVL